MPGSRDTCGNGDMTKMGEATVMSSEAQLHVEDESHDDQLDFSLRIRHFLFLLIPMLGHRLGLLLAGKGRNKAIIHFLGSHHQMCFFYLQTFIFCSAPKDF